MNRKNFLKLSGMLGLGGLMGGASGCSTSTHTGPAASPSLADRIAEVGLEGSVFDLACEAIPKVRVAVFGLGNRGQVLIDMLTWLVEEGHAEVTALSDINPAKIEKSLAQVAAFQSTVPDVFTGSEDAWLEAMQPHVADLALICTPWELHTPMALSAMRAGLHVASEVPIAYTAEDCIALVKTAEQTQRHCIMLENCCYNGEELGLLRMIEEGVFGTLTHAECAYLHDLRALMLDPTYYEDRWRLKHHLQRNGNLYTTHGLGPVCMYFDILRGDTLTHLVSMSSREAALSEALSRSEDSSLQAMASSVKCGDVNTTLIGTASGKSVMLQFDTHAGRPYNRLNKVIGSKAVHYGYPSRLYVDHGPTWDWHGWLSEGDAAEMRDRYAHPLWTRLQALSAQHPQGHGGMDFVMMYRLVRCLNAGVALDLNVYDGALWSLVGALSEESVSAGSAKVDIPDLTNGQWKRQQRHPVHRSLL
ncbi:MAG: Gfo/Idh/MocA family protein [Flavobacteriales bacterium]